MTPPAAFADRRERLRRALGGRRAIVAAGLPRARNFPANSYPFRAESHFLWLVGRHLPGAALLVDPAGATLFVEPPAADAALWHGPQPDAASLARALGLPVRATGDLREAIGPSPGDVGTLPPHDDRTAAWLSALLGRPVAARAGASIADGTPDAALADAMIDLRLVHDAAAVAELRLAAAATARAHLAGMRASRPGVREAEVCAEMEAAIARAGMTTSYPSIVTVEGEVLHHEGHANVLGDGDLVLADVGAETAEGWAGDVTRVWPASGRFSPTQRAAYDVVLAVQKAAVGRVRPGARYGDVHDAAARDLVEGLVSLGILRGAVDGLVERGAHALFFPHGIGHLLGLDVHDMEDLGDRAGYAPGRWRPERFGDRYLRLDRDLAAGMAVTIEPGFYQVPAILEDPALVGPVEPDLDRAALARFHDVRGIRIEDDVLVVADGPEVLTREVPKEADEVERAMRG